MPPISVESVLQEWNESVGDVSLGESEMVSVDQDLLHFLGFVHGLETEAVVGVDWLLLHGDHVALGVKGTEDCGFLWVDHGVVEELHHHDAVESCESLLVHGGLWMVFLVVEVWQEDGVSQVALHMVWVSEVASWSNVFLGELEVNSVLHQVVDDVAEDAREAMRSCFDTHAWRTNGEKVVGCLGGVTELSNVSGKKTSLRKTDNVEFGVGEMWIGLHFGASFMSLIFKVFKD